MRIPRTPALATSVFLLAALAACSSSEGSDGATTRDGLTKDVKIVKEGFSNAEFTFTCDVEGVVYPATINDVQNVVRYAAANKRSLKVTSAPRGSHSNNDIICPDKGDLVVNVTAMNSIRVDGAKSRAVVGPAATLEAISTELEKQGLAIPTMPDYTGISIAGTLGTSAHGSSLRIPTSVADLVERLTLVDGLGRLRTLQGEDARKAAVHGGWLGVLVEIELRAEPIFKVRYDHDTYNDEDIETSGIERAQAHDYARIHWFPEHGKYVVDYFDRVPMSASGNDANNSWDATGTLAKVTGQIPSILLNSTPTEDVQCLASKLRSSWWLSSYAKAPFTGPPVGVSYKMMGGTCSPGNCAWEARFPSKTRSVEVAFPLAKFGAWAQDVRGLLSKARGCFPLFGMYLRFSSGSNIPLDMAEGGPTVLFEIHVLQNVDPTKFENSNAVYDELQQMTIRKYGGRLHWGKNEAAAFEGVGPRAYPQWQTFEALRRDLDPQGVFENSFLRVVRGEESVEGSEGCVAKRQCICKTDVDCGPGYACSPGFQFEEARVCRKAKGSFCARGYDCSSGTCSGFRCQ